MAFVRGAFPGAELREWSGELTLPDAASALALWPNYGPQHLSPEQASAARREFERLVSDIIAREGAWRVSRHDGAFVAAP
jgi:hypothetical protein